MKDTEWIMEEVFSNEFHNFKIKQTKPTKSLEKLKSLSLFDIAQRLNSKPDVYKLDKED